MVRCKIAKDSSATKPLHYIMQWYAAVATGVEVGNRKWKWKRLLSIGMPLARQYPHKYVSCNPSLTLSSV